MACLLLSPWAAGFSFPKRLALMTHRMTHLTSQSVACGLLMSHFQIAQQQVVPPTGEGSDVGHVRKGALRSASSPAGIHLWQRSQ